MFCRCFDYNCCPSAFIFSVTAIFLVFGENFVHPGKPSFWKKPKDEPITFQMAWSLIVYLVGKEDKNKTKQTREHITKIIKYNWRQRRFVNMFIFNLTVNRIFVPSTLFKLRHHHQFHHQFLRYQIQYFTSSPTRYLSFSYIWNLSLFSLNSSNSMPSVAIA